jgi:hypothetical protein
MKIKGQIDLEISKQEAERIAIKYLHSLLPYDAIVKTEGFIECWYQPTYDGYGKSIIRQDYLRPVTEFESAVLKVIRELEIPF